MPQKRVQPHDATLIEGYESRLSFEQIAVLVLRIHGVPRSPDACRVRLNALRKRHLVGKRVALAPTRPDARRAHDPLTDFGARPCT